MKKIISKSAFVVMAAGAMLLNSCSNHDLWGEWSDSEKAWNMYEAAFLKRFGQPAVDQTWGFGNFAKKTRSAENPAVAEANAPYNEAWVADYLTTAYEVSDDNKAQNGQNFQYPTWQWSNEYNTKHYTTGFTEEEQKFYDENIKPLDNGNFGFYGVTDWSAAWYEVYKRLIANGYSSWANVTAEPTYVLNFKITGTWDGDINVVTTEGMTDGKPNNCERTVVVTGTWNLTADQKVGEKGRIIVAKGGKINISDNVTLHSVNEAQLVVLPGGEVTGNGKVEFCNGTDGDLLSYNGGTINVGTFNNNGGDFYNYGLLKAKTMLGGAGKSCYYNHNIINIGELGNPNGSSSNARIYNGCQFYCAGDMRLRNYEGVHGSSLICNGELTFSGSEDGTTDASYVGLEAGALVQCGKLYNNGTSWNGPTTNGFAVLDIIEHISFLNWEQDAPQNGGYFANNIYVCAGDWTNAPGGNGMGGETAENKFKNVQNAAGNGNVTIVEKSTDDKDEVIPTDNGFKAGESGCTPGIKVKVPNKDPESTPTSVIRVIAEDLTVSEASDFDFNDVVFDIVNYSEEGKTAIVLQAAGGTLPLTVAGHEVHEAFGVPTTTMVNTGAQSVSKAPVTIELDQYYQDAIDIKVMVFKGEEWVELTAQRGKVASKIGVDTTYEWCSERQDIEKKYPLFKEYVGNANVKWYNK